MIWECGPIVPSVTVPDVPWVGVTREEWLADDPYRGFVDTSGAYELLGWRPTRGWRAE